MKEFLHRTDTLGSCKVVVVGKQKRHWIEFQLVDEQGIPLVGMPYTATNEATRCDMVPVFTGKTNAEGVLRLEELHPLTITLTIDADALANEMKTRRLRAERQEPPRPYVNHTLASYGTDRCAISTVEAQARSDGHGYEYLCIGRLCDRLPTLERSLDEPDSALDFHFPDREFGGYTRDYEHLNRRHVLEICPFRSWVLVLHHQKEYSLTNAYNLALMSLMAYNKDLESVWGSPKEFFYEQCNNLSRTPTIMDNSQRWPSVVTDVSFDDRHTRVEVIDAQDSSSPGGDTQLFYVVNKTQVIVAWRGTEMDFPFADLKTDVRFRPTDFIRNIDCSSTKCEGLSSKGRVHLGFKEGFDLVRKKYREELQEALPEEAKNRSLFICGHSLGGALGLIHSADLIKHTPLLYTYGSPRAFSLQAVLELEDVWHFRHVNDNDIVPSVPPAVDMDNYLYDLYGPLGTWAGFLGSAYQWAATAIEPFGDPYAHHGEVAMLFRVGQHISKHGPIYQQPRNLGGWPYQTSIHRRLPKRTKLLLVPSLCSDSAQKSGQHQQSFCESLDGDSKDRYFPFKSNPQSDQKLSIARHFMWKYVAHIRNQLMECIDPSLMEERVRSRNEFEQQMWEHSESAHPDELARNKIFLHLQSKIGHSLHVTQIMEGGKEALERFCAVTDPTSPVELEI